MDKITLVPLSKYHSRIIAIALHRAKPKTTDRDLMDAWIRMCSEVGSTIREQGGKFDMDAWLDICFYGPK
jgi:hypothetical protein